jgi:hypothetical protein
MHPRQLLWCSGVLIFILMMATAFMGYVLPWGQMRFWGATVITSLVTALPVIGQTIVDWLWGGFTVNNATLNNPEFAQVQNKVNYYEHRIEQNSLVLKKEKNPETKRVLNVQIKKDSNKLKKHSKTLKLKIDK